MGKYRPEDLTRLFRTKITVDKDGDCWVFERTDRYGYGLFKYRNKNVLAHRFAYERLVGEIPEDMTIDHLCEKYRNCVNPEHMEIVDRPENSRRANARRARQGKY